MGIQLPRYIQWRSQAGEFEIRINARLCEREPLLVTCCAFMERYYVVLDMTPDEKKYLVLLTPKARRRKHKALRELAGEFYNEFLHNTLRYRISSRNQKVREMIVQEALFFSQPKKEQSKVARRLHRAQKVS